MVSVGVGPPLTLTSNYRTRLPMLSRLEPLTPGPLRLETAFGRLPRTRRGLWRDPEGTGRSLTRRTLDDLGPAVASSHDLSNYVRPGLDYFRCTVGECEGRYTRRA